MSLRQMGGLVSPQSVLVRGFSAKEIAIQNGFIAEEATDAEFFAWLTTQATPPRGLSGHCAGVPVGNEAVAGAIARQATTLDPLMSTAVALVAATGVSVFTIWRTRAGATAQIGTITFLAGQTVGVVQYTSTQIAAYDKLTIIAPAVPDATLADIDFLLSS